MRTSYSVRSWTFAAHRSPQPRISITLLSFQSSSATKESCLAPLKSNLGFFFGLGVLGLLRTCYRMNSMPGLSALVARCIAPLVWLAQIGNAVQCWTVTCSSRILLDNSQSESDDHSHSLQQRSSVAGFWLKVVLRPFAILPFAIAFRPFTDLEVRTITAILHTVLTAQKYRLDYSTITTNWKRN